MDFLVFLVKLTKKVDKAFSVFKKVFDIKNKPLTSLGIMTIGIVSVVYFLVWISLENIPSKNINPIVDSNPQTLTMDEVQSMIRENGYYGRMRNGTGRGFQNDFSLITEGKVVYDSASNLYWQQSGSQDQMSLILASEYIKQINEEKWAGYSDWRLPTLEEAMTLMEPERIQSSKYPFWAFQIDSIFDSRQEYVWTSDVYSNSFNYLVNYYWGFLSYDDIYGSGSYVRAVR